MGRVSQLKNQRWWNDCHYSTVAEPVLSGYLLDVVLKTKHLNFNIPSEQMHYVKYTPTSLLRYFPLGVEAQILS